MTLFMRCKNQYEPAMTTAAFTVHTPPARIMVPVSR